MFDRQASKNERVLRFARGDISTRHRWTHRIDPLLDCRCHGILGSIGQVKIDQCPGSGGIEKENSLGYDQ
jgi:hypothetical protein